MSITMKEIAKQMVREREFGSTGEIMKAIKEMFAEVLLEAQYICYANAPCQATHFFALHNRSRAGYGLGYQNHERAGEYEPKLIPKNTRSV